MKANEPAFSFEQGFGKPTGLTKRELFAAMALQSIMVVCKDGMRPEDIPTSCRDAVGFADALLAELAKGEG